MREDKKLPDGFGEYLYQQMAERRDRKNKLLGQGWNDKNKADNLNGGRPRQEYLDELEKARQDAYNHTTTLSDGFVAWMDDRAKNQHRERMEEVRALENHMFVKKEPHPMDIAIRERLAGSEKQVQLRNRMKPSLFPDDVTDQLRKDQQTTDPMDLAMRQRLADREARKKA